MDYLFLFGISFALSWAAVYFVMPWYIRTLKRLGANQQVSEYALEEYKEKAKTPIMGGLLFVLFPILIVMMVKPSILNNRAVHFVLLSYFSFGFVGFLDDFLILVHKNNDGLSLKKKLWMQLIFATVLCFLYRNILNSSVDIPFFKEAIDFEIFYLLFRDAF